MSDMVQNRYGRVVRGNAHRWYGGNDRLNAPLLIALSKYQLSLRLIRRLPKETT